MMVEIATTEKVPLDRPRKRRMARKAHEEWAEPPVIPSHWQRNGYG